MNTNKWDKDKETTSWHFNKETETTLHCIRRKIGLRDFVLHDRLQTCDCFWEECKLPADNGIDTWT